MRLPISGSVPAARLLVWPLVAGALALCAPAGADLRATPHNLMRGSAFADARSDGDLCVFCHTPMVVDAVPRAPLWQSSGGAAAAFATYDDIGRAGSAGSTAVGSQSLACLSCHDSNQAFSVTRSSMEHPYGIPYRGSFPAAGGGPGTTLRRLQAGDNALIDAGAPGTLAEFRPAYRGVIDDRTVWWASASGNAARRGRGDLPLYARIDTQSGAAVPHIECSTCHDPHSPNRMFLRTTAGGGELCLSCHNN